MKNDTISDIYQSISGISALEQRRDRLVERIEAAREQIKNLKAIYDEEAADVEKAQSHSLATMFLKLIGRQSGKLNKEMMEMLAAKFNYEKEREHIKDLEEENEDLIRRITVLKKRQEELSAEIMRREKEISSNSNHDLYEQYKEIQKKSGVAERQLIETDEALKAATKVLGSANASLEELEKAEHWTTSDMWGGSGLVSRTTKLSKIDHAQSTFNRLSSQMIELERELADVHLSETTILTTISTANHMVEFWFDNILSSQDVTSVLRGNRAQLRVLITQVTALIEVLERNEENLKMLLASLEQDKAALIATCHSCQSEEGEEAVCKIV